MNPFAVDFSVGKEVGLDHRFVGRELFFVFQATREQYGLEWEKAWNESDNAPVASEPVTAFAPNYDEDEIPF